MPNGDKRASQWQGKGVYICINFLDNLVKCMEQLKNVYTLWISDSISKNKSSGHNNANAKRRSHNNVHHAIKIAENWINLNFQQKEISEINFGRAVPQRFFLAIKTVHYEGIFIGKERWTLDDHYVFKVIQKVLA